MTTDDTSYQTLCKVGPKICWPTAWILQRHPIQLQQHHPNPEGALTFWTENWQTGYSHPGEGLYHLGPVFPCTFDGRSNWSLINFGTWSEIISITVFPSPINDGSSMKSPIKLMAEYWRIKSDNWRLNVAICSSLPIRTRNVASLRRSERQFTH